MELAGLEPATSWVRFGRALDSNSTDLQGFRSGLAGHGPVRMRSDHRRLPGVCPPKRRFGGKRHRPSSRRPEPAADMTSLRSGAPVHPFKGPLIARHTERRSCSCTEPGATPEPTDRRSRPACRPDRSGRDVCAAIAMREERHTSSAAIEGTTGSIPGAASKLEDSLSAPASCSRPRPHPACLAAPGASISS